MDPALIFKAAHGNDESVLPRIKVRAINLSYTGVVGEDTLVRHADMLFLLAASKQPTPSAQSLSDSESEEDAYGRSRHRTLTTKKSQQRRLLQPATEPVNTHGEVRFSTRKAAKVSNYNEDDEDPFDDEENILTPGYWITAPEEDTPAIDVVLNHRLREDRSRLCIVAMSKAKTYPSAGTEITTPGKEDFEYKVSIGST